MDNISDSKSCENEEQIENTKITNWLNSTPDDDADSILSDNTAISSSVADSEDINFSSLNITGPESINVSFENSNTSPTTLNQILDNLLNKNNSIQTMGNVNIAGSSHVHVGTVINITGPVIITSPNDPLVNLILNHHTTATNPNPSSNSSGSTTSTEEMTNTTQGIKINVFSGDITRKMTNDVLRMVDRSTWQKPKPYVLIKGAVKYVMISHSATEMAMTQADNTHLMRDIHSFHVDTCRWDDIAYNFTIGGDGIVYEGRGWGVVGAHTMRYNAISVGISFIGSFVTELPPPASLEACKNLIKSGVESGFIDPNYKLVGQCQCSPTKSPGKRLFEEIQTWKNFSHNL